MSGQQFNTIKVTATEKAKKVKSEQIAEGQVSARTQKKEKSGQKTSTEGLHTVPVTTLMMCNIPSGVGEKEIKWHIDWLGFGQKYDLLHVVPDQSRKKARNFAYGFINFRAEEDADAFRTAISGHRFPSAENSANGISMRPARTQGLLNSIRRLAVAEEKHGLMGSTRCFV
mmetsp:Transcript_75443/g.221206  ORF Transcript_75443/g.221206 Transcript_75443/m.221206 type:complete len:171 (-) Transcript_75443:155-667(-)